MNFSVVSKSMNYLKNVLDSIYKSIAPANIPTQIEMNILVRFEVIEISSFSERQLISRKFTAEVYKASAESHQSLPHVSWVHPSIDIFVLKYALFLFFDYR